MFSYLVWTKWWVQWIAGVKIHLPIYTSPSLLIQKIVELRLARAKHIYPSKIIWLDDIEYDVFSCLCLKSQLWLTFRYSQIFWVLFFSRHMVKWHFSVSFQIQLGHTIWSEVGELLPKQFTLNASNSHKSQWRFTALFPLPPKPDPSRWWASSA